MITPIPLKVSTGMNVITRIYLGLCILVVSQSEDIFNHGIIDIYVLFLYTWPMKE